MVLHNIIDLYEVNEVLFTNGSISLNVYIDTREVIEQQLINYEDDGI